MIRGLFAFVGLMVFTQLCNFRSIRRMIGGRWSTVTGYVYGRRWVKLTADSLDRGQEDYTRHFRMADMDAETRKVIYFAHIVARNHSIENIGRLNAAISAFDKKHEVERTRNLLNGIFGDAGRNEVSEAAKEGT